MKDNNNKNQLIFMNTKTIYFKDKPRSKFFKAEIPEQFNSYPEYWQSLEVEQQILSPEPVEVSFAEYAVNTAPDFLPFDNHLLVLPEPLPEKVGSLYVPLKDKEQEKTHWGVVVIPGTNPEEKTVEAQIGDFIGYSRFAGTDVEIDGETYRLIRSSEIHGKIPGKSLYKLAKGGYF